MAAAPKEPTAVMVSLPGGGKKSDVEKPWQNEATRYAAYLARAKMALARNVRYAAYFSDVGESLRPVIPRWAVNLSYGISFG